METVQNKKKRFAPKRGDIYLVDLGDRQGSIQRGVKPAIITSNYKNNTHSPTINIVPITSRNKNELPVHIELGVECGLNRKSTALAEQITTISKDQLLSKIGKCNKDTIADLERAILIQMGMAI